MSSTKFDSQGTKNFMAELKSVTEELAREHGVTLASHSARYGGDNLKATLTFETVSEDGESNAAKARWSRTEWMEGLHPDMFGQHFTHRGTVYKVVDLAPRSPKYPVLAERSDGKVFKFQVGALRELLAKVNS